MPWARFEDDYLGNRKLATLSTAAIALDMAAIIFSARELRDGRLSGSDVQAIASLIHMRRWTTSADELLQARRWEVAEDGYVIHDYLDYQPSREDILKHRVEDRERKRRGGRASAATWIPAGIDTESTRTPATPVPGPGIPASQESSVPPTPSPDADAQGASPTASARRVPDDALAVIHAEAGICPFCRLPYTGTYLDHTSEKHAVKAEPGPGNLGPALGSRKRRGSPTLAPPPEIEAQFAAMHERLQSLPGSPS